jgi:putative membrane protein
MSARTSAVLAAAILLATAAGLAAAGLVRSFSGHMTLHVMLVAVIAPLLAPAAAAVTARRAWTHRLMMAPVAASLIEFAVVWLWHAPDLHMLGRRSAVAFIAEHGSFLAAGILVWTSALTSARSAKGGGALAGALALLMTSMHMTLLGALIGLAGRPLYAHDVEHGAAIAALGDQQIGAVIMLTIGGASYLIGGIALLARLLGGHGRGAAAAGERR